MGVPPLPPPGGGGVPPSDPEGRRSDRESGSIFPILVGGRGEGPENGFSGFSKMSRKRVFPKFPIVQGPRFLSSAK